MGQRHTEQSMIIIMFIIFLLLITLIASILSSKCYVIFYDNYGDRSKIFLCLWSVTVRILFRSKTGKSYYNWFIQIEYYFLKIRNSEVGLKAAYGSITFWMVPKRMKDFFPNEENPL